MKESYTYKPFRFFLLTNLITWVAWLIAAYFSYRPAAGGQNGLISLLLLIGLFSPMATALWMIFASGNPQLKQNFYGRLFNFKLIRPWTIPAIFLIVPAAVVISVWLSHLFFKQPLSQLSFAKAPFFAGIIPAQLMLLLAPLVEEIGWKGYGVESLRGKRSFFTATLLFAALWAFWHGPTFFVKDYYQNMLIRTNPLFALNFVVSFLPVTVIFQWLWYKNRGSILTAYLCHGIIDVQGMLQMGQAAKCIETGVFIIIAIVVVVLNKKMFFGEFPAQIGYYGQ